MQQVPQRGRALGAGAEGSQRSLRFYLQPSQRSLGSPVPLLPHPYEPLWVSVRKSLSLVLEKHPVFFFFK